MSNNKFKVGYCDCACRDCLEVAIGESGKALCHKCEGAGCEAGADRECQAWQCPCVDTEIPASGQGCETLG